QRAVHAAASTLMAGEGNAVVPQHRRARTQPRESPTRLTSVSAARRTPVVKYAAASFPATSREEDGGGGNRTRVRGSPEASVYKLRPPFGFARRPVCDRPTDGLALLRCRASGEWLSFGAEPACYAGSGSRALPGRHAASS